MDSPLISVIIIFLNGGEYLEQAVQSVINQTYTNWELLLVDDGSTDSSSRSAKKYAEKFPGKIFYLTHPGHENKGMSASRNLGIKASKGDFITFLDSDDIYLLNKLEEELKFFRLFPGVHCVFGPATIWFSWNSNETRSDFVQTLQIPSRIYYPGEFFSLLLSQKAAMPAICSLMIRRETAGKLCFEEKFTGMYEDQVFYFKTAYETTCFIYNESYAYYRIHLDSEYQKSIKNKTALNHKKNFYHWLMKYVEIKGVKDRMIINKIKKEIWLSEHPVMDYIYRRSLKQQRKLRSYLMK